MYKTCIIELTTHLLVLYALFTSEFLCYCTAELLSLRGCPSSRPSSVRPSSVKPIFSETVKPINAKIWGKLSVHHISRAFSIFQNFILFLFYYLFHFINMGPHWRKKSNDIPSQSTQQIHSQIHPYSYGGLYQSRSKNCEVSNLDFYQIVHIFLNMGPYGNALYKRHLI